MTNQITGKLQQQETFLRTATLAHTSSTDEQSIPAKTGLDWSGAILFIHFIPSVLIIMFSRYNYTVVKNIAGKKLFSLDFVKYLTYKTFFR